MSISPDNLSSDALCSIDIEPKYIFTKMGKSDNRVLCFDPPPLEY